MATSNYALRLPVSLKREVERVAREDGSTLNQFIVIAVAEKLEKMRTEDLFAERSARADVAAALSFLRRNGGEPPRDDDAMPADIRPSPIP